MKGFIEGMIAWYDFDTKKYHWHNKDKNKNPDQLELPLDEPKVQDETQKT